MRVRTRALRFVILLSAALSCSPLARAATTTYTYDALGRLTRVTNSAKGADATYGYDAAGNRTQTTSKSESLPPSVPTGLSATPVSGTQINLAWSASTDTGGSGLAGYRIYRGGSQIATSATPSYSNSSLTNATTYTYSVAAYDAAGNASAQSSPVSATTFDTTPPSIPSSLTGSASSATQVNLSWAASTDNVAVTGYAIFRGSSEIGTSSSTAYSDLTVTHSTSYSYSVKAYDAAGNRSTASTPKSVCTPDLTAPSIPASVSATVLSPSRININWSASSDIGCSGFAGYKVYRNGSLLATTPATGLFDNGLAANTAYSYTVVAYDNAGNNSNPSSSANATTWPLVAANLSTTSWNWLKRNSNPPRIDPDVVCTGSGGSGSGYTYAWQFVSGDGQTSVVNPTGSSTKWSRSVPTNITTFYTSTWRCLVTDGGGNTGQSTVTVTFTMQSTQFAPGRRL